MGSLSLSAPFGGTVVRGNEKLRTHPQEAITDPYGEGWIAEVQGQDPAGILGLHSAEKALADSDAELQSFRRTLAIRLLTERWGIEGGPDQGTDALTDLRQVLGGPRYLDLVKQYIC